MADRTGTRNLKPSLTFLSSPAVRILQTNSSSCRQSHHSSMYDSPRPKLLFCYEATNTITSHRYYQCKRFSIPLAKGGNDSREAGKCECRYDIEQDGYQNNRFKTPTNGD